MLLLLACLVFSHTVEETLSQIEEKISERQKGAYFCFDAEDIEVALGKRGGIGEEIEMQELLSWESPSFLKSYFLPYTALHKERWAAPVLARFPLADYPPIGSALLATATAKRWVKFLRFLRSQNLRFIGDIPPATKELLFGSHCQILKEGEQLGPYTVILLGTDWRGKIEAKQLLEQGDSSFVIDLSLLRDPLSHWHKEDWDAWIKKSSPLKILYTSALLPEPFEERKGEYIQSLQIIKKYGFLDQTYIVEALGYSPLSFFEEYSPRVFYVNQNDRTLINRGVNEAKTLKEAFDYFGFEEEEMIVKLTGRYFFNDESFLQLLQEDPDTDAFVSYWGDKGIVTSGCFAMRGKYFKQMLDEMDLDQMEQKLIALETVVTEFLTKIVNAGGKVRFLNKIGITANVANQGIQEQQ